MQYRNSQRGITFWGLLFVFGVLAFVLFLFFRLLPPYLEDFKVKSALDSLARQPDYSSMTRPEIVTALEKRFDIDNVTAVDLKRDLIVETKGRKKIVAIRYENIVPIAANLSALIQFDHTKETASSD